MNLSRYEFIQELVECNYLDFLISHNITIVHFTQNSGTTFLLYKDEIFIFESTRSLNKAYTFYNVEKTLCDEGIEYYKITRNYLDYLTVEDLNVKNGESFNHKGVDYLINYHTKGYQNKKSLNLHQLDNRMFYLIEYCEAVIEHGLVSESSIEMTSVVTIKNKINYQVDMFPLDTTIPKPITKKFKVNKELQQLIDDKDFSELPARMGIFFIDGYKDCNNLDDNRTGGFIYYALENYNIIVRPFKTISLKEIYSTVTALLEEVNLPISITTDNDFLYDIFFKTFDKKIDFILDKSNLHNRFIKELSMLLTLNHYDSYGIQSFVLILENNYNEVSTIIDEITISEYERMLFECLESYKVENIVSEDFEFEDFEEFEFDDEEEENEVQVDSNLLS